MEAVKGDLWDWHAKGWKIVVSTNIGWTEERPNWASRDSFCDHHNNMGAGIAYEASKRWPWLPSWLGGHYRSRHRQGAPQLPIEHDQLRLIFVAVKPLLLEDPAYSWNQKASLPLIAEQLQALARHRGNIAIGYIGCGNGQLEQAQVEPALLGLELKRTHAGLGRTVLVDREVRL